MAIPESPRVTFEINPLEEVVCQLKFPSILRIDAEAPAAFQEAIREQFPVYRSESSVQVAVNVGAGPLSRSVPTMPPGMFGGGIPKHVFETSSKDWAVTLTRDALGLVCRRYERWEDFGDRLAGPRDALLAIYRPQFFNHVCLRYRDVIRKGRLGLPEDTPWGDLISPWIGGLYNRPEVAAEVESVQTRGVLRLPAGAGRLDASYGLALEQVAGQPTKKTVFLIDAHVFKDGQTGPNDVTQTLAILNEQAGRFFRWCITRKLYDALRPRNPVLGA